MGTIYDGRLNERAEDWDLEHLSQLADHAVRCGLSVSEAHEWAAAQNPHRREKAAPRAADPLLFRD